MTKPPAMTENELKPLFLLAVPVALPNVRIFNRPIFHGATIGGRSVSTGITGQADTYAVVRGGLHVEIELKAERGQLRERQKAWRRWCFEFGIPYLMPKAARGETPEQTIARWCEELKTLILCNAIEAP